MTFVIIITPLKFLCKPIWITSKNARMSKTEIIESRKNNPKDR